MGKHLNRFSVAQKLQKIVNKSYRHCTVILFYVNKNKKIKGSRQIY